MMISNVEKFKKQFNWKPKLNDINIILKSSIEWEKKFQINTKKINKKKLDKNT